MQDDIAVSTVIGHIYEASYNPLFWPIALENITNLCSRFFSRTDLSG